MTKKFNMHKLNKTQMSLIIFQVGDNMNGMKQEAILINMVLPP